MSEGVRAICLARAQGNLKFDALSQSMRSCFPDYTVARKKTAPVHAVEEQGAFSEPVDDSFGDVELFLAEHGWEETEESQEVPEFETYDKDEAAEILAATWKERRAELNMVQKSRKSFLLIVEEVAERARDRERTFVGPSESKWRS